MDALGLLKELEIHQAFTFKGKQITYAVVGKEENKVLYRRIDRGCKNDVKRSFFRYDKLGEKHFMCKIYEHSGEVQVFDFLPF